MAGAVTSGARERKAKGLMWLCGTIKPNAQQISGLPETLEVKLDQSQDWEGFGDEKEL